MATRRRIGMGLGQAQAIEEDEKVADNTRGRRRRNRRRKRNRADASIVKLAEAQALAVARPQRRRLRRSRRNAQAQIHEEYTQLHSLLSEPAKVFFTAATHPFSQEAPGAVLPDGKGDSVLPALDRWSFDIPPTLYDYAPTQAIGIAVALLPRSLGAGWIKGTSTEQNNTVLDLPIGFLDSGLVPLAAGSAVPVGNLCSILMFGINTLGQCVRIAQSTAGPTTTLGINVINMSRTVAFDANTENARLLGAGLKIFSDEAPINTGGTCYGGSIPAEQLYSLCTASSSATGPGIVGNLEKALLHRVDLQGLDGSTTRYNPFQDPGKQLDFVRSSVADEITFVSDDTEPNDVTIAVKANITPVANDQIAPGTLIPMCVWKWDYDSADPGSRYTLRVTARAHLEGTPSGTSPFITHKPDYQPGLDDMYAMCNNRDVFPTAVAGHSFKSFLRKIGGMASIVSKYASKAGKIAKVVETFI